jgi:adenylosuccinate lyase
LDRIRNTPYFASILPDLESLTDPKTFIGRCPEIVEKLVKTKVAEVKSRYSDALVNAKVAELHV